MKVPEQQPFLRWAGGKRWLKEYIKQIKPDIYNNYYEPFLGGGAVFFGGAINNNAILSDVNKELIETYIAIRDEVENVINKLKEFENTKECYYKIRSTKFKTAYSKAARFIYLNKTSFNGIYRVNKNGDYNVPYGYRKNLDFISADCLMQSSIHLQKAKLYCCDFGQTLKKVKRGDFVYLDPPYTVAHENNGFIHYNQKLFSVNDQKRLANWLKTLNEIGAFYILSNAKHEVINEIYKDTGTIISMQRNSLVGGSGAKRILISEYLITNINDARFE